MHLIPFTKMHGTGNDFVVVDALDSSRWSDVSWPDLARKTCDRHFGIGADGLILILPSSRAAFRMRMLNPDGSEAQMCGNGIRCFGRYLYDRRLTTANAPSVETLAGILTVELSETDGRISSVRVDMGIPILEGAKIPTTIDAAIVKDHPLPVAGQTYLITCVSMGNPHAVVFLDRPTVDALRLDTLGPHFENHPLFPERINTEFCAVVDRHTIRMRVWERGAGETLACGTGASASAVAAMLHDFVEPPVTMILDGGRLVIDWAGPGHPVYLTGPAEYVFTGEYYYGF